VRPLTEIHAQSIVFIQQKTSRVALFRVRAEFLGTFVKLRKATAISVMSAPLYVRPYGTTGLPLDGFS